MDTSYFLASVVPRLTRQIVESSVYAHLEEVQGVRVASATRRITVERATEEDQRLIHLGEWIASSWSPRRPSTRRVCSSSTRARAIHRLTSPSRTPPTGCRQSAEAGPANLETQLVGSEPSSFGDNRYW
ncbi:UTRA domain-containing protein [Actinomyces johnsonii]|uniref:UTRA domain-containing protein n=1 Tax=Actinomyces johnsonii TaxID=544581 RepID=UPI001E333680